MSDNPEFAPRCVVCSEAITKPGKCPDCRKSGAKPRPPCSNISVGCFVSTLKSYYEPVTTEEWNNKTAGWLPARLFK